MSEISICHLKKYFGQVKAVDDVSLEIDAGEIVGFLGPNGAGKTTTISCLLDFLKPTAGTITIHGLDAQKDHLAITKEVGFIPADVNLYDAWTGQEHIDYVTALRGRASLLSALKKDFQFDSKVQVRKLSTGNKQKLAIILALMNKPRILILDEPSRGLDPLLQNVFYRYLAGFQKDGATIFVSSHNLAEVEHICSRVAIIRNGKLVEIAKMSELEAKKIHIVHVKLAGATNMDKKDLQQIGAEIVSEYDHEIEFRVTGDINPLLDTLSKYAIVDLSINHASLEEIFLKFYQ